MLNGTVKWYDKAKGYGFIIPEDGGRDVFVHISAIEKSGLSALTEGQKIAFDIRPGRDGRSAADTLKLRA